MKIPSLAGLLILPLALAASARGDVMRYEYAGTIASADPSTGLSAGTPVSGVVTIDSADQWGGSAGGGTSASYFFGNAPSFYPYPTPNDSGISLSVDGVPVTGLSSGLNLGVENVTPDYAAAMNDYFNQVHAAAIMFPNTGLTFVGSSGTTGGTVVRLFLSNPSESLLPGPSPTLPPSLSLANFPSATFTVTSSTGQVLETGTITSFQPMPAPEPSTLFGFGLAAAALAARRRRSRPNS